VRRELPGGYELDDDPARLDVDAIHRYLSEESYWAKGRSREKTEIAIAGATRVIGLYKAGAQVGFARVLSDGIAFAYLADVFVLPEHRGHGRGVEVVREAIETPPWNEMRWILGTVDAHGLYAKFGFQPPSERILERRPAKGDL
jgi:GNAT superfamily N-acetyltransferase